MSINRGIELATRYPLVALGGVGAALFAGSKMLGQNAGKKMTNEVLDQLMLSQALKSGLSTGAKWGLGLGIPAIATTIGLTIGHFLAQGRLKQKFSETFGDRFVNGWKVMWHSTFGSSKELNKLVDEKAKTSGTGKGSAGSSKKNKKGTHRADWLKADPEVRRKHAEAGTKLKILQFEEKQLKEEIERNDALKKAAKDDNEMKQVSKILKKIQVLDKKSDKHTRKINSAGNNRFNWQPANARTGKLENVDIQLEAQYSELELHMHDDYSDDELGKLVASPQLYTSKFIDDHFDSKVTAETAQFNNIQAQRKVAETEFAIADKALTDHKADEKVAEAKDKALQDIADAEARHNAALKAEEARTKAAKDEADRLRRPAP